MSLRDCGTALTSTRDSAPTSPPCPAHRIKKPGTGHGPSLPPQKKSVMSVMLGSCCGKFATQEKQSFSSNKTSHVFGLWFLKNKMFRVVLRVAVLPKQFLIGAVDDVSNFTDSTESGSRGAWCVLKDSRTPDGTCTEGAMLAHQGPLRHRQCWCAALRSVHLRLPIV